MKRMTNWLVLLVLLVLQTSCKHDGVTAKQLEDLSRTENAMFEATDHGDSSAFRKMCGMDYYTINANGEGHTLEETIPAVPRFKGFISVRSDEDQRVFGDFVLRNGRLKVFAANNGPQVAEVLYTTGWMLRDGRWQFVHWQGTLTGMMLEPLKEKMMLEPPKTTKL